MIMMISKYISSILLYIDKILFYNSTSNSYKTENEFQIRKQY